MGFHEEFYELMSEHPLPDGVQDMRGPFGDMVHGMRSFVEAGYPEVAEVILDHVNKIISPPGFRIERTEPGPSTQFGEKLETLLTKYPRRNFAFDICGMMNVLLEWGHIDEVNESIKEYGFKIVVIDKE